MTNYTIFVLITVTLFISGCASTGKITIEQDVNNRSSSKEFSKRVISTSDQIIKTFGDFLQKNKIRNAAIAVSYQGDLVGSAGKNRTSTDAARIASLSKAITAVCTMKALDNGLHSISSTLGELIPIELDASTTGLKNYGAITIEQLITHSTGVRTNHMSRQARQITKYNDEQKYWQLSNILKQQPILHSDKSFYYANANYLILGLVIEKLTNNNYEKYCIDNVLTPLNITTAKLSPKWRILSAFGGWEISAADYLLFADTYFNDEWRSTLKAAAKFKPIKSGSFKYGLGVLMRKTKQGTNYWHNGEIIWKSIVQNARFASYVAAYNNDFTVSLNYAKVVDADRSAELDEALYHAIKEY